MARMDRYKQRKGQARLRRVLLFLSAVVVMAGLAGRLRSGSALLAETLAAPTATPIAAAFDETMETREITLNAVTWYALQTGIFGAKDAAQQCANQYADRGAPGLVVKEGDKYRVLIASYGQQADAAAVRERLAREQLVETWLYPWASAELTLRLTGMAGQLDVASAGLTLMEQTACQLRDAAIAMDAGVTTAAEAAELILELDGQVKLWADTARKRFAAPYPELVDMELSLADGWSSVKQTLTQAANENAAELSAAFKVEAMRLYARVVSLRASLAG